MAWFLEHPGSFGGCLDGESEGRGREGTWARALVTEREEGSQIGQGHHIHALPFLTLL